MAYQDVNWNFLQGGSIATSAATWHALFGNYTGLSSLNASEIVVVRVAASTGQATLNSTLNSLVNADSEYFISPSDVMVTLPRVATTASNMGIVRLGTNNPSLFWSIWTRNPL